MASFEPRGSSIRAIVYIPGKGPGSGKQTATFDTEDEARRWATQMEAGIKSGRITRESRHSVGDLLMRYLDAVAAHTDSGRWNRNRIMRWCQHPIALTSITRVTTDDMSKWVADRAKEVSASTILRELNLWSAAFTYGINSLKWLKENPCRGLARPVHNPPRSRSLLKKSELEAIWQAAGVDLNNLSAGDWSTHEVRATACFALGLETGMRSGEMLRLKPEHVDLQARVARVTATEQGGRKGALSGRVRSGRHVPLTQFACTLLEKLIATMPLNQKPRVGQSHPPYIIGMKDSARDAAWRKVRDRSGVKGLTFHDSKHEAATRLAPVLDVLALSHAIGTKDVGLLRDTYYQSDAAQQAMKLPARLA